MLTADKILDYLAAGCEILAVLLLLYGIYAAVTGSDKYSEVDDREYED